MPACTRGVTLPIKKLFESIPDLPGDISSNKNYFELSFPSRSADYISENTKQLLLTLIDRIREQLRACSVNEISINNKHYVAGKYYSNVSFSDDEVDVKIINLANVENDSVGGMPNFRTTLRLQIFEYNDGGYTVTLNMHYWETPDSNLENYKYYKQTSEPFIRLYLKMDAETHDIRSYKITSRQMQKVLDTFDPMGTGYEFITPDELERYEARFPTPESREGHTLLSPELRHYRTVPSLQRMLKRKFDEKEYPEGETEAYNSFRPRMRLTQVTKDGYIF